MEVLFELILQLFLEVFFQILVASFVHLSKYVSVNTKVRKILKYLISILVFGSTLTLLYFSIIQKRELYLHAILVYFIILTFLYIARFIAQNDNKDDIKSIIWLTRLVHYIFPIIMITLAVYNYDESSIYIIISSCIALLFYIGINAYRIHKKTEMKKLNN